MDKVRDTNIMVENADNSFQGLPSLANLERIPPEFIANIDPEVSVFHACDRLMSFIWVVGCRNMSVSFWNLLFL